MQNAAIGGEKIDLKLVMRKVLSWIRGIMFSCQRLVSLFIDNEIETASGRIGISHF